MSRFFLVLALLMLPVGASATTPRTDCEVVYFDVSLAPGSEETDSLYVEICTRNNRQSERNPVQLLVHGGSYDHRYWDPGWDGYSYVEHMVRRGYTVVNIDRVGVGRSSKPADPMTIDFATSAYTIHQLVQAIKGDGIPTHSFGNVQNDRVVLVGFSFGSMIATMEAATYDDVDGLVLQAYSHTVGPAGVASYDAAYPALMEPKFNGLPQNYFTTIPGLRPSLFFHTPNVHPFILQQDEVMKQTYTLAELMGIGDSMAASYGVRVPVFLIVGDKDFIACDAPSCTEAGSLDDEGDHFPLAPSFEVEIVPDAGHTLNWHNRPNRVFSAMDKWLRKTFR